MLKEFTMYYTEAILDIYETNSIVNAINSLEMPKSGFWSENWDWMIAVASLFFTVYFSIQNTKNYKKETQSRLEIDFYDFIIEVNLLKGTNERLKLEINQRSNNNTRSYYRKELKSILRKYASSIAPMVGRRINDSGIIVNPLGFESVRKIKVPIKDMPTIISLVTNLNDIGASFNRSEVNLEVEFSNQDFEDSLLKISKIINENLSEYFY